MAGYKQVYDLRSNTGETYDVDPKSGGFLMIRPPQGRQLYGSGDDCSQLVRYADLLRRMASAGLADSYALVLFS